MINQLIYNLNFFTLLNWLLPTFLRKKIQRAWVTVFVAPLESLYNSKQLFRASIVYKLQHNGQVIYLEKMLNEYFDITGYSHQNHQQTKKIFISAGDQKHPWHIYTETENKPQFIYTDAELANNSSLEKTFIYTDDELSASYTDFIVWVPSSLNFIEVQMKASIEYYINTKKFLIKTY